MAARIVAADLLSRLQAALERYREHPAGGRPHLLASSRVLRSLPFFAWLAQHAPQSPAEAATMQQLSGELIALRRGVPGATTLPASCAVEAKEFALAAADPSGLQAHAWTPEREAQLLRQVRFVGSRACVAYAWPDRMCAAHIEGWLRALASCASLLSLPSN